MNRIVVGLVATLFVGCQATEEPMQNSPETDAILDRFGARLRFGDTFETAAARGHVVDSHIDESGSTLLLALPGATHGFSMIQLVGTPSSSRDPASVQIFEIVLLSESGAADRSMKEAKAVALQVFDRPGVQGCIHYIRKESRDVTVWGTEASGAIAVMAPRDPDFSADDATTSLIVFPRGQKLKRAFPEFRTTDCGN